MKKYFLIPAFLFTTIFTIMPTTKSNAFIWAIVKAAIVKTIKAADLAIQKLQNKTIALQNAQKELENEMSKLKLGQITDWAKKEKDLFSNYYDELAKVKAAIATYRRVKEIAQIQLQLVNEYKTAWTLFKNDKHFTPSEVQYMYTVYSNLINQSVENIDELLLVTSSFETKMSDGKRLDLIAAVSSKMQKVRTDLLQFNRQNMQISLHRATSQDDVDAVKKYYGIP